MRKQSAPAEQKLWQRLRDRQLNGFKFRRQQVLDPYIADFFCHAIGLVIEIDGGTHERREVYDANRTVVLDRGGCRVIRFLNEDVHDHLHAVLEAILEECERLSKSNAPSP